MKTTKVQALALFFFGLHIEPQTAGRILRGINTDEEKQDVEIVKREIFHSFYTYPYPL